MNFTEIKKKIIKDYKWCDPDSIIIFGSYARNDCDQYSDIDLIVVYPTDKKFLDRLEELYLSWDIPKGVDILAYTPEEFESLKQENAFIQDACAEGITIYERTRERSK